MKMDDLQNNWHILRERPKHIRFLVNEKRCICSRQRLYRENDDDQTFDIYYIWVDEVCTIPLSREDIRDKL